MHGRFALAVPLAVVTLLAVALHAQAQSSSRKPAVPSGAPTRQPAIAVLSSGIDYLRPGIAARLARDGEGDIIGFDAIDGDARPYLRDAPATRLVEIAPMLVAPFRLDLTSTDSWNRTLTVLARTPVRLAVVSAPPSKLVATGRWDAPMAAFANILFVVPADDVTVPTTQPNVIVVATQPYEAKSGADLILAPAATQGKAAPASTQLNDASDAAMLLAGIFDCTDIRPATSPADVKKALIAKAARGSHGSPPVLNLCR